MRLKEVPGYEGYFASDTGYIYSKKTGKMRIRKSNKVSSGYHMISVSGRKSVCVHIMVAKTWLKNNKNLPIINHKDGNKENNSIANLEYVTRSDNAKHAHRVLGNKGSKRSVCRVTFEGKLVDKYESIIDASRKTGVCSKSIRLVCNGKMRKTNGYLWCYAENYNENLRMMKFHNFLQHPWSENLARLLSTC